ncbi:Cof-type HAD-IIB family hydrolase [Paenibacillus sp. J2TS4]|uniref:Cof-type HAD-IIB family hydrolase n=1 Tax=Paenibacillus sp. J2TS4 TaxID=2807194 RepID=UPI001B151B35|nr:Cof-type HAD-IIB family hydrolase [Paenibacillus sp. J2TS4]GIP35458.1 5-amino-6-(5-phospho-D-ribitylamino)uracil phosphatase YcsE [Paenibacillus sp. J2TS4]
MINYRLLALDLDETVLDPEGEISEENKEWIGRADKAGVVVVITTGRGRERVEHIRKELGLDTPMVLANGAELWEKPEQLLQRYYISQEDIRMLHAEATKAGVNFWGYNDEKLIRSAEWTDDMFEMNFLKFGMSHPDQQVVNSLREKLQTCPTLKITWSAAHNIEISQNGVSKETGIRTICDHLGIQMSEVMAIGDNINDLELIQTAGLGVAMGNGEERLKRVADRITDTNEQDGVAKAIQDFLLN